MDIEKDEDRNTNELSSSTPAVNSMSDMTNNDGANDEGDDPDDIEDDDDDTGVDNLVIKDEDRIKLDPTPAIFEDDNRPGSAVIDETDDPVKAARKEAKLIKLNEAKHKNELKSIREEQNAMINKDKNLNSAKRLEFLQRQAEVFARFTSAGESGAGASGSSSGASGKKKKKAKDGDDDGEGGRTRKSEEEEDAELIDSELHGSGLSRLTVQPGCITGKMRPYQIEGLNWMINLYEQGINGILADEMGLGKTLQSISLLGYLKFERGVSGPHIVIVPKSVLGNWLREVKRWCPGLRAVKVHGTKDERARQLSQDLIPGKFDVVVTTYEVAIKHQSAFNRFEWRYIVIDEAHRLKNEETRISVVARELKTQFRLLITGTPLQNNLHELWALLNFLLPEVFNDSSLFEDFFKLEQTDQENVVSKLHSILRPFMIRRLKSDVEKSLPPKREIKLYTGMTEMQEYWYRSTLNKDVAALNQLGGPEKTRLLNILMQLRKVCNHPYLFQGAEPGPPYIDGPHLWENAGKMVLLDKLLTRLRVNGDRVLIFSQMTRMLDILEDYMRLKGYQYCRIDGNTKGEDRDLFMDEFNAPNSEKFVFLLSTRAGGLGINLATANIVILYDSDFNPQMDLQAQDRAHRIGQTKEVTVFRFVTEGTVEEKIVERAEKKLYLDAVIVQQGRLQQTNKTLDKNELMAMVKFGAEAIFKSGGVKVTDEEIDLILDRGEKRTEELRQKFQTDVQHNLLNFKLDTADEKSMTTLLLGEAESANDPFNFINLGQRNSRKAYDVSKMLADEARAADAQNKNKPKGIIMHDFQFFDQPAMRQIEEKEHELAERRRIQMVLIREAKLREKKTPKGPSTSETPPLPNVPTEGEDQQEGNENGELESEKLTRQMMDEMDLSSEDKETKQRLLEEAFGTWNRRDFRAYVGACEKYGRNNIDMISNHVVELTGKAKNEIKSYHETFWKRYKELQDWEKIIERVEKGEQKIVRRDQITGILERKVKKSKNPWQTLTFDYGQTKGKMFTEEEDRFLVCMMQKIGYGNWEQLRQEIRKAWCFRFDWFIKSRTPVELQRRCDALIRIIEKEEEGGSGNASSSAAANASSSAAASSEDKGATSAASKSKKRNAPSGGGATTSTSNDPKKKQKIAT